MTVIAFIGLAAVGTVLRFLLGRWNTTAFPWGTFVVNTVGSFILGWATNRGFSDLTLLGTALLGSLTTFSTLTHESLDLHAANRTARAAAYLGTTLVVGIGAAWFGFKV